MEVKGRALPESPQQTQRNVIKKPKMINLETTIIVGA
jgi:hypothetical protein